MVSHDVRLLGSHDVRLLSSHDHQAIIFYGISILRKC